VIFFGLIIGFNWAGDRHSIIFDIPKSYWAILKQHKEEKEKVEA
jgi:hypothetical protein